MRRSSLLMLICLCIFCQNICKSFGLNSITGIDGDFIIAVGDSGRIIKSSNSGDFWSVTILTSSNLNSVYSAGKYIWIVGDSGKIYKLNTSGSILYDYRISDYDFLSVFFVNEMSGYICGDNGNVYKTNNGGMNWFASNNGILNIKLNSITFSNSQNGYVAGENGYIYKTTNGGASWKSDNPVTGRNILNIKYYGDTLLACGEFGLLMLKANDVWKLIDTRTDSDIRSICIAEDNSVRICGGAGFIRNNKNGSASFLNFENNPMRSQISDMHFSSSSDGYAINTSDAAIIRTTNGGITWGYSNTVNTSYVWESKLTNMQVGYGNTLALHPFNRNTLFVSYGDKIYVSRDKGENWNLLSTINIPNISRTASFFVSNADTNIWVALVFINADCPVLRTTDYGATWTKVLEAINVGSYTKPLEMDWNIPGSFCLATTNRGFFSSTNNGNTFAQISNYDFNNPCDLTIQYGNSNNILLADASYPANDSSNIYKSTDGGISWERSFRLGLNEIPTITNSIFNNIEAYAAAEKLYRTHDFGNTWTGIANSFEALWALDICREDPTNIFTARFSGRGYLSGNEGNNFVVINHPSSSLFLSAVLFPERDYAIGMFHNSLYKLKFTTNVSVNIEQLSNEVPSEIKLYQNYPNPFNPSTKIKFDIRDNGLTTLRIYNYLGKEIETLVSSYLRKGTYEVIFDGSKHPSGMYFYKLQTGNLYHSRKLVLIK